MPFARKKITKKKERGYYDYKVTDDDVVVIATWNDNSIVNIASNCEKVLPARKVLRFSQKEKKRINVEQPALLSAYNSHMGGVDRADQNISLYRVGIRGKKWYFPLLAHCLDMSVQNAWQLHREEGGKLDQLCFRRRIALYLLQNENKTSTKRCRFSSLENVDTRYDKMEHYIKSQEKQTRCRLCHKKVSTICEKCNVALHIGCFIPYHTS